MYIEINDGLIENVNRWALQRGLSLNEGLEAVLNDFFTKKEARVEVINDETMLLSENALAEDWLKPEEEEAWGYLQSVKL
jgi:hypothetical protein